MKLPFAPAVNKINDVCYIVPAKAGSPYRTIIKCDETTAQVVNLLSTNIGEGRMIEQAALLLPNMTTEEITTIVRKVRDVIGNHEFKEKVLEVIEI